MEGVQDYLPAWDGKPPERDFFFKVLYTLHPNRVDEMIEQAGENRNKGQKNLQDRQWSVVMPPEWINELLKYDFVSSKYSSKTISIILSIFAFFIQARRVEEAVVSLFQLWSKREFKQSVER